MDKNKQPRGKAIEVLNQRAYRPAIKTLLYSAVATLKDEH